MSFSIPAPEKSKYGSSWISGHRDDKIIAGKDNKDEIIMVVLMT